MIFALLLDLLKPIQTILVDFQKFDKDHNMEKNSRWTTFVAKWFGGQKWLIQIYNSQKDDGVWINKTSS